MNGIPGTGLDGLDGLGVRWLQVDGEQPLPSELRLLALPNGMEIACQSHMEGEHIYEDIFDKRIYLRNGITLRDGLCVFDVGGNIGLFTLFIHSRCRDAVTYTFEPAPPLFEILRFNAGRYAPGARLINAGASDRRRTAELTFYPYSSGMSSFHADVEEEKAVLRSILEHQHAEGMAGMDRIMAVSEDLLDGRFVSRTYECPLLPISEVIAAEGVEWIDLLKIDVQKSELEVLQGIEPRHWPRIRQIVMEVHDLDGRLEVVVDLLRGRGFNVTVEQDPLLTGSVLWNLFAVSRSAYGMASASPQVSFQQLQSRASRQRAIWGRANRQGRDRDTP
jgi:phthiocerol/phenolphthiocerol synthesis type-I polyketide synthase E